MKLGMLSWRSEEHTSELQSLASISYEIHETWHAIMEWHPTCCGIFCVHFERRSTRITANKDIFKEIAATLTLQTFV